MVPIHLTLLLEKQQNTGIVFFCVSSRGNLGFPVQTEQVPRLRRKEAHPSRLQHYVIWSKWAKRAAPPYKDQAALGSARVNATQPHPLPLFPKKQLLLGLLWASAFLQMWFQPITAHTAMQWMLRDRKGTASRDSGFLCMYILMHVWIEKSDPLLLCGQKTLHCFCSVSSAMSLAWLGFISAPNVFRMR